MIYDLSIWKAHGYNQPDIRVRVEATNPLEAALSVLRQLGLRSVAYVLVFELEPVQMVGEFANLDVPDVSSAPVPSASVIDSTVTYDYSW